MSRPNRARSIGDEANLALRMARERKAAGLSYEGLAKLMTDAGCGVQGSAIYKIEKGDPPRRVAVNELVALATVLGKSVDDLLTPIEVLDNQRAKELVKELDDTATALMEDVTRVVRVYREWLQLAQVEPELFSYVAGHHDRNISSTWGSPDLMPQFRVDGLDGPSATRIYELFRQFWSDLVNLTSRSVMRTDTHQEK